MGISASRSVSYLLREPESEPLQTGPEEPLLGTEQLIDDRLRDPRATRELIHRRLREATLGEQLLTELDELPLPDLARHPTVPKVLYPCNGSHSYSR